MSCIAPLITTHEPPSTISGTYKGTLIETTTHVSFSVGRLPQTRFTHKAYTLALK